MRKLLILALCCVSIVSADFVFDKLRNQQRDFYEACDYGVIGLGGGTAVTAGKIAEEVENKVICIVESGKDYLTDPERALVEFVDNLVELSRTRKFARTVLSTPQYALLNATTFAPPRVLDDWVGNVTGGGGSVNSLGYRRPQKFVFDELNQPGWSYEEVLAAYDEIETRVNVTLSTEVYSAIQSLMAVAFNKSGYPLASSPLDNIRGHWQSYWTSEFNNNSLLVRTSSYLSYILPNLIAPKNGNRIKLFTQTRAEKLINIPTLRGVRNIGVVCRRTNTSKILLLGIRKRVIVGAGVYATPQLLMLSGIGPKHTLQHFNITAKKPTSLIDLIKNLPKYLAANFINPLVDLAVGDFWAHTNLQTIHLPNPAYITGFSQTENRKNNMFGSGPVNATKTDYIIGLSTIFIQEFFPTFPIGFSEIITTNIKSRGNITLASANPRDAPIIDHRLLTHPDDIVTVGRSFKEFRQVMAQPEAMNAYPQELAPGASVPDEGPITEGYIRSAAGVAHVGGGAQIGPVVDAGLKVKGTLNIHVCDMSVYPNPVGVNTYSTAMLAGYQCARFILDEDA